MSNVIESTGRSAFKLAYEISPIILVNGLAQNIPGGLLPIMALTEVLDIAGALNQEFFASYRPLPGSTLEAWQAAEYPFANLKVAANAVVQQPLNISMLMVCPSQTDGGYILKQAIMTALKTALDTHILAGGTFTVITPAYTYTNCLMTNFRDISPPSDKQVQLMYQMDFVQPLIQQGTLQQTLNGLMNKLAGGLPTSTSDATSLSWSGQ